MKYFFYLSISLLIIATSCNDSQIVGSDLLGADSLDVTFDDQLDLSASTVIGDSTITFRKLDLDSYTGRTYMVGEIDDPAFGKSTASAYFNVSRVNEYPNFNYDSLSLDSVVMILDLDSLGRYGNQAAVQNLELFTLSDRIDGDSDATFYSNQKFDTESTPIFSRSQVINYTDSLLINPYILENPDSLLLVAPQLRFNLDKQFWEDVSPAIGDTLDDEGFNDLVPGFELRSSNAVNSMLGIDLNYSNSGSSSSIRLYYTSSDTTRIVYLMRLGRYRHNHFRHDYSGSSLESDLTLADADCLYLQSQGGSNITIDISEVKTLQDRIVNNATIEFSVKTFDEELYPPTEEISAWYKDTDDDMNEILVRADRSDIPATATETYPSGEKLITYTMNVTGIVNQVKKGELDISELIIIADNKAQRPNRSLIYGRNHPDHPLKLNLILTNP